MTIEFRKTSTRTYAIRIRRDGAPPLEMNPAPGYDELMPHDLLHLIVERELGLEHGIFGQVAAGGHAGTFHDRERSPKPRREAARDRRRLNRRGDKLLKDGREESALSERATYVCLCEWLARARDPAGRARAQEMAEEIRRVRAARSREHDRALSAATIDRICARLDELSARWRGIGVGQDLVVEWPYPRARAVAMR
jgi:hypothetical protein